MNNATVHRMTYWPKLSSGNHAAYRIVNRKLVPLLKP
jgi:hypothetical protein